MEKIQESSLSKIKQEDWKFIKKEWKVVKHLGSGTFGQVVLAKHRQTKQEVAIKLIKDDPKDIISNRNLLREISLLSQFSQIQDNIFTTKLLDIQIAGQSQKTVEGSMGVYLVMEYTDNDIQKLMQDSENYAITEDHLIVIIYNVLTAIHFVHSTGAMHRDIKPSNILLDEDCQVKICDFGLARCILDDSIPFETKPSLNGQKNEPGVLKKAYT